MGVIPTWARWRFGERVCVACGRDPDRSINFPPPWWGQGDPREPIVMVWQVPVCAGHRRVSHWPVRTMGALYDEQVAIAAGLGELTVVTGLWEWAQDQAVKGDPQVGAERAPLTAGQSPHD